MTDPYKILGISPDTTDDEVKKAYRQLAKQYHPDNYVNNPLADLAAEKMKEINSAYDTIIRQREAGSSSGTGTGDAGGSGFYGSTTGGNDTYSRIRVLINSRRTGEAEVLLQRIPESERNAEWHFLMGHVLFQKGWLQDARAEMETACRLDPYNTEYRAALDRMNTGANKSPYGRTGGYDTRNGCTGCGICGDLLCADCCCECMGGDLISCC